MQQQSRRVVITDCDHGSVEIEREVAERYGYELVLASCVTSSDVIAASAGADAILTQVLRDYSQGDVTGGGLSAYQMAMDQVGRALVERRGALG